MALSHLEIAQLGQQWYENQIRPKVETAENLGKMVLIDIETGEFEIASEGLQASQRLHTRHPEAPLFGIRIGYRASEALGGILEREAA
jgi:hypothetical protein